MEKIFNQLKEYLGAFSQEQWLWLALTGITIIYIFYNRKKYVQLFDNAVVMAETSFNHGENRKKLQAAVQFVISRISTLPLLARIVLQTFISEKRIVDLIEKSLQKFSDIFGIGRKVDIKGNE